MLSAHALHRLNVLAIRVTVSLLYSEYPLNLIASFARNSEVLPDIAGDFLVGAISIATFGQECAIERRSGSEEWHKTSIARVGGSSRLSLSIADAASYSGFLGSTSETMIANLFESAQGMGSDIQLRLDEMGPGDADITRRRASADLTRVEDDGSPGTDKKPASAETTSPTFTSPLGKLFSKVTEQEGQQDRSRASHKKGDTAHTSGADLLRTHAEEFDDLRRQLDAMRDGQDRLEAMLRKFMTSADKKWI